MKKITLFLMVLLVSVLGLSAIVAGASASTVLFEDFYRGEYADFKNGEEEIASKDVVIFFGSAPTMEENVEYGVALQKDGSNQITYYKANKFNENDQNKFGIAISVGGDANAKHTGLQAGTYTVKAYERSTSDYSYANCIYSAEQTITISLDEIPAPTNVTFDKANGIVGWDAVNGAEKYIVKLYAGDTTIYEGQITETTINFSEKLRALDGATLDALQDKELAISVQSFTQNNKLAEPVVFGSELIIKVLDDVSDIKAMNSDTFYGVLKNDIIVSASDFSVSNIAGNDWGATTKSAFGNFVSTIDGLGNSIIVSNYTSTESYALFWAMDTQSALLNLVIEEDVVMNCSRNARRIGVVAYNLTTGSKITNCYVKARIDLIDGQPTNRIHLGTANNGATLSNCVFDVDVTKNGQDAAGVACTLKGTGTTPTVNNCVYIANDTTATMLTSSNYVDMDAFITAFKAEEVENQSTYTAWSVRNDQLFLYDTQLTFETIAGPTELAITGNSATWTAIDGVEEYTVKILGDETVYTGTVSGTTFDISKALASVSGSDLDKLNSKKLSVKVSASVQNANCEYTSVTSTYTVKVLANDADVKAMATVTNSSSGVQNTYGILKSDIIVTTADLTNTGINTGTASGNGGQYVMAYGTLDATSTIDGLGHKIIVDAEVSESYALFQILRGTIQNLGIETNVKTTGSYDAKRVCLLGYDIGSAVKVTNCYFDGTVDYVQGTVRAHVGMSNAATYTNCVFDVNVLKNSVDVAASNSNYAFLRMYPVASTSPVAYFTNCAYVVNDTDTNLSYSSAKTSMSGVGVYTDIASFITAFKAEEVANQSTYTAWSVDANDKLCLVGTQIA